MQQWQLIHFMLCTLMNSHLEATRNKLYIFKHACISLLFFAQLIHITRNGSMQLAISCNNNFQYFIGKFCGCVYCYTVSHSQGGQKQLKSGEAINKKFNRISYKKDYTKLLEYII